MLDSKPLRPICSTSRGSTITQITAATLRQATSRPWRTFQKPTMEEARNLPPLPSKIVFFVRTVVSKEYRPNPLTLTRTSTENH